MQWRVALSLLSILFICVLPIGSHAQDEPMNVRKARSLSHDLRRELKILRKLEHPKCLRGELRCSMPCFLPSCKPCPSCPPPMALPPIAPPQLYSILIPVEQPPQIPSLHIEQNPQPPLIIMPNP